MRISGFLNSIYRRILTIYERSSHYDYWNQAAVAIFVGIMLIAGVSYGLYRVLGLIAPAGIFAVTSVAVAWYRRNRFLSPSSVRLQAFLFLTIQRIKRIRERNTSQMLKDAVERNPHIGAVAAPVLCLIAFPIVAVSLPSFLQNYSIAGGVDETVWVVHATVTGFSFIVLIFFWEFLGDEFDNAVFIRTAVRYTWSLHIIYFLLAANIIIGVLAIIARGKQVTSFVGVQVFLFLLSIFGVYRIYDMVYRVMVYDMLTPRIKRRLDQQIGILLTEPDQEAWISVMNHQLEQDYPQMALPDFTGDQERVTAGDLGLSGEVTDIHLHQLHNLINEASALDVDIERLPVLGESYHNDDSLLVYKGDLTEQEVEHLQTRLRQAIMVK